MMSKKEKQELKSEILQVHGFLNDKKSKCVATIAWGDEPAKINIRTCWDKDGELKVGKGVTLDKDEVDRLTEILVSARNTGEIQRVSNDGRKAVNFSKIFGEATDIVDKRESGYTTQDGFIKLKKKPGVKLK